MQGAERSPGEDPASVGAFLGAASEVAARLLEASAVHVLCHFDGDGLCSGGLLLGALHRANVPVQVSAIQGLTSGTIERIRKTTPPLVVTTDVGSGQLDRLERLHTPVIVLDHHVPEGEGGPWLTHLNPRLFDLDGTFGACGTTIAFLVTLAMSEDNWGALPTALAGIVADRQHLGGARGLNGVVVEQARERKLVRCLQGIPLRGETVDRALKEGIDPFVRRLHGDAVAVEALLQEVGLDPMAHLDSLSQQQHSMLSSRLCLELLEQGADAAILADAVTEQWFFPAGGSAHDLSAALDACGRLGRPSVGLAAAVGDRGALAAAMRLSDTRRGAIAAALRPIVGGALRTSAGCYVVEVPESGIAGAVAALTLMFLVHPDRPVLAVAPDGDRLKLSLRGSRAQIARGLDLHRAMGLAVAEVGGSGGGHPIAAGGRVPPGSLERALTAIDREVCTQLRLEAQGTPAASPSGS